MRIGYARVSTDDQTLDLQRDALKRANCRHTYEEQASGKNTARPQLEACLKALRKGDTLVVWKLDRLARSTSELLRIAERLTEKNAGLQSLEETWADTTTPAGRMVLTMFSGVAADSDEGGHRFQSDRGHRSNLMAAR